MCNQQARRSTTPFRGRVQRKLVHRLRRRVSLPPSGLLLAGVLSDTHGLVRPEIFDAFHDVDLIVHAGDVGGPAVLQALARCAPVLAVRGNVDTGAWAAHLPDILDIEMGTRRILVVHDRTELPQGSEHPPHVVISGHSHRPLIERREGALHLNPGSAGPRRFRLPVSLGFLTVDQGRVEATIRDLPHG